MPITIRHELPGGQQGIGGALAGLGDFQRQATADARQTARMQMQLDAQRDMQLAAVDAQASAKIHVANIRRESEIESAKAAHAQTAMRAGLGARLQERDFQQRIELNKQEAKLKAEQWEQQYTAKQRQDIARLNKSKEDVMNNPAFSPDEKEAAMRAIEMQIAGVHPSMIPRDPNKPTYEEGKEPGKTWLDEQGNTMTTQNDGTPKLILRPDQSKDYLQAKLENEIEIASMKRVDAAGKLRADLMRDRVKTKVTDPEGRVTEGEGPAFTPQQIDDIISRAYPQAQDPRILEEIPGELVGPQVPDQAAQQIEVPLAVQEAMAVLAEPRQQRFKPDTGVGPMPMSRKGAQQIVDDWKREVGGVRDNLPKLTDDAAGEAVFERLPDGTEFIAPDGKRYRK